MIFYLYTIIFVIIIEIADGTVFPGDKSSPPHSKIVDSTNSAHDRHWIEWKHMDQLKYVGLLTSASIASTVISHPLHVITMRQQAGIMPAKPGLRGILKSTKDLIRTIGVKGLFRGWIPLMLETPSYSIYFIITEISRQNLQHLLQNYRKLHPYTIDAIQSLTSSFIANTISLIPWVPCEVLTAKLAMQDSKGIGMIPMITQIYKNDGISGFFRGFGSSLGSHVIYSFEWWASYSIARREMSRHGLDKSNPILYDTIPGIIAGIISCIGSHPIDTFKTRIMTGTMNQKSIIQNIQEIINKKDFLSVYSGLSASLVAGAISSAVFCLAYEYIKRTSVVVVTNESKILQ
eukprot:gene735-1413_t